MDVPGSETLVEVTRGPLADAVHRGHLAVVTADGTLLASVGDPCQAVAYLRSSAKPFQAMCVIAAGAGRRWGFSDQDIALIAGSHNGEHVHVALAEGLLRKTGLREHDLRCGSHPPLDRATSQEMQRRGVEPTALHNNCSGKHIGMLSMAVHLGNDPAGYPDLDHPVQQRILWTLSRFAGLSPDEMLTGIDGCGVPCFGMSVYSMALAYARLMKPQSVPAAEQRAADRVTAAMMSHPYLVAGRHRLDTAMMTAGQGALVSKGGAAGVQCVGLSGGVGLAVKVADGADAASMTRPAGLAAVEALRQMRLMKDHQLARLSEHDRRPVRNLTGQEVGEVRAVFSIGRSATSPVSARPASDQGSP